MGSTATISPRWALSAEEARYTLLPAARMVCPCVVSMVPWLITRGATSITSPPAAARITTPGSVATTASSLVARWSVPSVVKTALASVPLRRPCKKVLSAMLKAVATNAPVSTTAPRPKSTPFAFWMITSRLALSVPRMSDGLVLSHTLNMADTDLLGSAFCTTLKV